MKVLHVVPSYLPAVRYGGPIFSVHGLCKALSERGHDVEVFTTNIDGQTTSDVPIGHPVNLEGVKVWFFPVPIARRLYWSPAMGMALRQRVASFDVVHTHSVFLWPTWAAARVAQRRGIPYVLAPRGMLVEDLIRRKSRWAKRAWLALIERKNLANAALIHFTSRLEAEEAAKLGVATGKSCVVPNGLTMPVSNRAIIGSPTASVTSADRRFLLFIGRINWKKGLDRLIGALPGIPDCDLVVAGNDEEHYQARLETLALQSGVHERISFIGPTYGENKNALLRSALALILPSYSENFGNVVLEAMAAGCPVAVTPEVGAAEIVRESGAGVVVDGDPLKLGAGIRALLADPDALKRMGENGREHVISRYSWQAVSVQMEAAYVQAMSR